MNRILRLILALMILAFFVTGTLAQSVTTGSISGIVTDQSGAAVPDITVTATSPNLIQPQSATTGPDGRYSIFNLPPGKYTVTAEAQKGFAKIQQRNLDVNLGKTSTGDLQLQLSGVTAEVSVTVAPPVDVVETTIGSNVSTDQFSNFPTARTVQGLYTIAPSATRSGLRDASGRDRDPSIAGSSGPENNYILDGVSTGDPAFGGGGANLPFEFVQEVEIKTGAYGAEYGKSTGGIFNVITKSGGNDVHGDVFGFGTSQGLVRKVKNFPFTGGAANGFAEADIGGDVGGPIKKDKLWFFAAANPQWRKNYFLTQTFHQPVENKVTIPFYAGKVTWAPNNTNTFTASTFGDFTKIDGFFATQALTNTSGFASDPASQLALQEQGGHNYSFRLNSNISPTFIAEISSGPSRQGFQRQPTATGRVLSITWTAAVAHCNAPLPSGRVSVLRARVPLAPTYPGIRIAIATNSTPDSRIFWASTA